jgi:hypothetical protein
VPPPHVASKGLARGEAHPTHGARVDWTSGTGFFFGRWWCLPSSVSRLRWLVRCCIYIVLYSVASANHARIMSFLDRNQLRALCYYCISLYIYIYTEIDRSTRRPCLYYVMTGDALELYKHVFQYFVHFFFITHI